MLAELWRQYKQEGDIDAKEKLILKCFPMIKSLAHRFSLYASPCCNADDLASVGIIGLLDAVEKYNPLMQTSFKTYAKYRIRGAILDEIRKLHWTPRSIQEKAHSLRRAYNHLEQIYSRPPNEEELAEELNMDLEQFRKMLVQIGPSTIIMLSQRRNANEDDDANDMVIEDPDPKYPIDQVITQETKDILIKAIKSLNKKESIVITLYYYEEMTMREIGKVLSLTESRICQIHSNALLNLFQMLKPKMIPEGYSIQQEAIAE
ncbi:FliA/WhiG family RNA polymerase sigma factor [Candidatus Poribacteria bacterium]|nr:FliA/WhiG family RNA polymerase sigma factor [Candidatus Poribacteria bacterium]